jgi:hypothetical protein
MTAINNIRVALEAHLSSTSPALPAIAWPNVPFTPVPGTTYLRTEFIPVTRRPVTAGPDPEQRINGLYYITVYTQEDQGAAAGMGIADALLSRFNGSTAILAANVTVRLEYSEVKQPLHDPPFFAIPVEIGWYAFKR